MFKKFFLSLFVFSILFILAITPVLADNFNLIESSDNTFKLGSNYRLSVETAASNPGVQLSAEYLLSSLAQDKKNQRVLGGSILTVSGGALIAVGVLAFDYNNEEGLVFGILFDSCGGILAGAGLLELAIPTLIEREYAKVQRINDPTQREQAAYGSLVSLAEKAKYQRIISGIASAGLCIYYIINPYNIYYYDDYGYSYNNYNNYYAAATLGATAIYSLLVKSPEESMLDRYRQANSNSKVSFENESQKSQAYKITIMPYHDGLSARLVYSY